MLNSSETEALNLNFDYPPAWERYAKSHWKIASMHINKQSLETKSLAFRKRTEILQQSHMKKNQLVHTPLGSCLKLFFQNFDLGLVWNMASYMLGSHTKVQERFRSQAKLDFDMEHFENEVVQEGLFIAWIRFQEDTVWYYVYFAR